MKANVFALTDLFFCLSHCATLDAADSTCVSFPRAPPAWPIQIFWLLTPAKMAVSSKDDSRLQSISSHKATSDITDSVSLDVHELH